MNSLQNYRKNIELRDRLIFAMDVPDIKSARGVLTELKDEIIFYKFGLQQIYGGGLELIKELKVNDNKIFIDAKLLDIGETVFKATENIAKLGVDFLTVHAEAQAVKAAKRAIGSSELKILAVTVMTSLSLEDIRNMKYDCSIEELVLHRSEQALNSGADGLVCSAQETVMLREKLGNDFLIITPGIRPSFASKDDQKRIVTPKDALVKGSDYLVIGRPIMKADNKVEACRAILAEMKSAYN